MLLAVSSESRADVITLRAELRGGGSGGAGMFGKADAFAFQEGAGSLEYGFLVGGEFFFIDAWIQHHQFINQGALEGTFTLFMAGLDTDFDLGEGKEGKTDWFSELGMGFGLAVGTGQQVDPPLDNSEVTDKGFLLEARGMVAHRLGEFASLGLTIPLQMGYYTKSGPGIFANDQDNHYTAMSVAGLLTLRANWNMK
jgi:hypothetical protein